MIYQTMTVVEDEQLGGLGLSFDKGRKFCNGMFTAQNGLLVAHDIIEHQQGLKRIGTIGDEMLALGAICYSRGQWGYMRRQDPGYHSPEESIASDVSNMFELYCNDVPFRQKLVRCRGDDDTCMIDDVIEAARTSIRKSLEYMDPEDNYTPETLDTYLEETRIYMLQGVKLAIRRFGSGMKANNMFWNIEAAAEQITKHLEFEGQQFRLDYDGNSAKMQEVEYDYGY